MESNLQLRGEFDQDGAIHREESKLKNWSFSPVTITVTSVSGYIDVYDGDLTMHLSSKDVIRYNYNLDPSGQNRTTGKFFETLYINSSPLLLSHGTISNYVENHGSIPQAILAIYVRFYKKIRGMYVG